MSDMGVRLSSHSIAILFLLGLSASVIGAEDVEETHVRARLVADTPEIQPGSIFRLGVHFEIDDGWHIYWRNPGGAGLATSIEFELPDDVGAGPLEWPLPIGFTQSEGIPGYGYEGSVILASRVTAPMSFDRSRQGIVRAEVSWLACKEVCVLGSAELEASLSNLPLDQAFEKWNSELPASASASDPPFTISTTGGPSDGVITLWLRWNEEPRPVEWFPNPSDALEVGDGRIKTRGGLTRIDATVKSRKGSSGSTSELPSLFVVSFEDGDRRGWEHSVELASNTNKGSAQ